LNSRPVPADPWSERIVDGACLVFAAWTLACHMAVAAGGSLWLAATGFVALLVALPVALRRLPDAPMPLVPPPVAPGWDPALRAGGILAACVAAWTLSESPLALWWAAVGLLGAATLASVRQDPAPGASLARGRGFEAALWGLALGCAGLALLAHRPDLDDAFYLNLAVAAVDDPRAALLAEDTLHGIAGLPVHYPTYRVHTWELWNALWSRLTGVPVIAMFHWVSALLAAALIPLAWARLFRRLVPSYWLAAVCVLLLVLIVGGDLHRGYGNFAFVRIWQGKSVVLSVLLPVVAACALDFSRAPSWRRGLLLAATQIAALGCSSSALWAAPAVSLSAAACALRPGRAGLRRLALAASTSIYLLGVGAGMQATLAEDHAARLAEPGPAVAAEKREERASRHVPGLQLEAALATVLGDGAARSLGLVALLGGWAFVAPGLGRRYACVVPLAVLLVLLNPYTSDAVSRSVVGNSYWRTFWVLPIPALLALSLSAAFGWGRGRVLAGSATLLACGLFALVPDHTTLSPKNDVRLGWPGFKVTEAYRVAELFHERMPAGASVVAPRAVAAWLPTFTGRTHPLLVRDAYLRRHRAALGHEDLDHRLLMTEFVSGVSAEPNAALHFAHGLERYAVRGVLLAVTPTALRAREALRDAGFEKVLATLEFEIWTRI